MAKSKKIKNIAFIGTVPPPLGGVAMMNKSIQEIFSSNLNVLSFNTSEGSNNENLYKKKGYKNLKNFSRNINGCYKFICNNDFKTANIFVTSNLAFLKDSIIIILLKIFRKKIIVHFHS